MESNYPELFQTLYARPRQMAKNGNVYGCLLALRDFYEALIRWYVLTGLAYAEALGEKELVSLLCDPNCSLSFGDWVQIFPKKLSYQPEIGNSSLGKLLQKLNQYYNANKIVTWRNEAIGHGALQQDTSQEFRDTLENKLRSLKQCLAGIAPFAAQITFCKQPRSSALMCTVDAAAAFPLSPFIHQTDEDIRLFDSLPRRGKKDAYKELSYLTGLRTTCKNSYFFELQNRYFGDVPVAPAEFFDEAVFTRQLEHALQHFHDPRHYWKQTHYIDWIHQCLQTHNKGVFLLQAESGTGKSTFCTYIDGFGEKGLEKLGITCRVYHFSRMSFRSKKEFTFALHDLFRQCPEDGTDLAGQLPILSLDVDPDARPACLAAFLKEFQNHYYRLFKRKRIMLVLDGIDELQPSDTDLLNCIPDAEGLPDDVYLLVTCRSDHIMGTFQESFLHQFHFTERKTFQKEKENRTLLQKAIQESVFLSGAPLSPAQTDRVCNILDNRFTGLPVIRAVLEQADDFDRVLQTAHLLNAYVQLLQRYYGAVHFQRINFILETLALAIEPLSISQIAALALDEPPSSELLAIMRDISPLLVSIHEKEGAKYILGHPDFSLQLRQIHPAACQDLVRRWQKAVDEDFDAVLPDYEYCTYICAGLYLWCKDVLKESLISKSLLNHMRDAAGYYSMSRDSGIHLSRMVRIMSGVKCGYLEYRNAEKVPADAAIALDIATSCIQKLVLLEDMQGCLMLEKETEALIASLPEDCFDRREIVLPLFISFANRSAMWERFGNYELARIYHGKAVDLLFAHSDWIPNQQQIPFIHNCGISLLQNNPDATIQICDRELHFPECTVFQQACALLLKSDALKIKGQQQEAGICIRKAVALVRNAPPSLATDVAVYPNALFHLGSHLCHVEQNFAEAVTVLTEALNIHDDHFKLGALPDRFEAARLLCCIGESYHGMDAALAETTHKDACFWYLNESIKVYRVAIENNLQFQPASAEPIFLNAAFAYDYYGERAAALRLIDELEGMQNPHDAWGKRVLARCADTRAAMIASP